MRRLLVKLRGVGRPVTPQRLALILHYSQAGRTLEDVLSDLLAP